MTLPVFEAAQHVTRISDNLDGPKPREQFVQQQHLRESVTNLFESPDRPGKLPRRLGEQRLDEGTAGVVDVGALRGQIRDEPLITVGGQLISSHRPVVLGPQS